MSELNDLSTKQRTGKLLSGFLRQIAQETINAKDSKTGEFRAMMKAEALARQIWDRALGIYVEIDPKTKIPKKLSPDKGMINLIIDRTEGKVPTSIEQKKENHESIPDKISKTNTIRLNQVAIGSLDD